MDKKKLEDMTVEEQMALIGQMIAEMPEYTAPEFMLEVEERS